MPVKSSSQKANGQKANGQKANGQKANGQKAKGQKAKGQKADGEKATGQAQSEEPPARCEACNEDLGKGELVLWQCSVCHKFLQACSRCHLDLVMRDQMKSMKKQKFTDPDNLGTTKYFEKGHHVYWHIMENKFKKVKGAILKRVQEPEATPRRPCRQGVVEDEQEEALQGDDEQEDGEDQHGGGEDEQGDHEQGDHEQGDHEQGVVEAEQEKVPGGDHGQGDSEHGDGGDEQGGDEQIDASVAPTSSSTSPSTSFSTSASASDSDVIVVSAEWSKAHLDLQESLWQRRQRRKGNKISGDLHLHRDLFNQIG